MMGKLQLQRLCTRDPVRVDAVDNIDFVAALSQAVNEPVKVDGVSAETVGRIENRNHAESGSLKHRGGRLSEKKAAPRAFKFYQPAQFVAASILARFGPSRLTVWSLTHLRLAACQVPAYDRGGLARQTLAQQLLAAGARAAIQLSSNFRRLRTSNPQTRPPPSSV